MWANRYDIFILSMKPNFIKILFFLGFLLEKVEAVAHGGQLGVFPDLLLFLAGMLSPPSHRLSTD